MVIREMSKKECLRRLAGARLARLACSHDNQPYVVPVYLACDEASGCLYGFTTPGQKIEWMRANPRVCVEVDEIVSDDEWVSVIADGSFEELPDSGQECPPHDKRYRHWDEGTVDERERAWEMLKSIHPVWWEPGCTAWAARVHRDPNAPLVFVYYRIRIDRVTGHEATREARDTIPCAVQGPPAGKWAWLRSALERVLGGGSEEAGSASGAGRH